MGASDDPRAEGEVGRVGMAVDTLADMEEAFEGIDLNQITVSLTINGSAVAIMAMYFAMARKRGFALEGLRGNSQNDILKEFIGRGTWISRWSRPSGWWATRWSSAPATSPSTAR